MSRQRVGLIGLGAIGSELARLVAADPNTSIDLVCAVVPDRRRRREAEVRTVSSLDELLTHEPNVVAEAAGHEALRLYGPACLRVSLPLVLLSAGALADPSFESELIEAATAGGVTAVIASGATAALDMIGAAAEGGLDTVVHTIVKPPTAFGIDADTYREIFRGSARAAATQFPQNANIAAAIALAGVGLDKSEVVVAVDPAATVNRQMIDVGGAFGRLHVEIENRPSPENPRTGLVVAMSLKHVLEKRARQLVIG